MKERFRDLTFNYSDTLIYLLDVKPKEISSENHLTYNEGVETMEWNDVAKTNKRKRRLESDSEEVESQEKTKSLEQ